MTLYVLQQLLNGAHLGALYALLAFGYALTNALVRRTNLAYGALFAFSGQTMILAAVWGWDVLWLTLPAAVALGVAAGLGYGVLGSAVLGRSVLAPLARRSPNTVVAATLGASIVLMELARIAADTRDWWLPPMLATPVVFAEAPGFRVTLTAAQIGNCTIALFAIAAMAALLGRSRWGREWRALADDPAAAALCGVDTARVFGRTMLWGGLIAALAGVLAAFHYGNVSFGTGLFFGLKILFVTAAGGFDHPGRAAAGAGLFGVAEAVWTGFFAVEWRDAWMFAGLVALLVLGRAGESAARPG